MKDSVEIESLVERIMRIRECHNVAFNEYVKLRRDGYLEACEAVGIDINAQIDREGVCCEMLQQALPKLGVDLESWSRELATLAQERQRTQDDEDTR